MSALGCGDDVRARAADWRHQLMHFKLDQNLDRGITQPLVDAGHDLKTAEEQALQRADDPTIATVCKAEGRCLITADLGFAQIIDYPPDQYPGLVVVRHPRPTRRAMRAVRTDPWDMPGRKMDGAAKKVLRPGLTFDYEYDFGSTTALTLRAVGVCNGGAGKAPIALLARNNPTALACSCGKPATEICTQCAGDGEGWLCTSCADAHACGEESLLPVVNSSRVGVCGYTG